MNDKKKKVKKVNINVKNINGTSSKKYVIYNAQEKYIQNGGQKKDKCAVKKCGGTNTEISHVIKCDKDTSNEWYVTRLCHTHNSPDNKDAMLVDEKSLKLVKDIK